MRRWVAKLVFIRFFITFIQLALIIDGNTKKNNVSNIKKPEQKLPSPTPKS